MPSYIVKSADIGQTLRRIEEIVSRERGHIIAYKRDFIPLLQSPESRRIQHFYYCDDHKGISVRLFDSQFVIDNSDLNFRKSRIIFRADQLGKDDSPAKQALLRVWDNYEKPPRDVNTNNVESADKYFASLNGGTMQDGLAARKSTRQVEDPMPPRYNALWESTFIGGKFYQQLEETIANYRQVVLEGPPGAGKTWVAREFARWWTSPDADAAAGSEWQIVQLHESY